MRHEDFAGLDLQGQWLCDVDLAVDPQSPGTIDSPWGATSVGYIAGGEFAGPVLNGHVLPGGGDWPALSSDGENSYRLDVRAVWETTDGARLFVQYYGFIVVDPALTETGSGLAALKTDAYYFRSAPTFRTADKRYSWLNKTLCIGIGRFTKAGLGYRIFAVK